jgi:hypothetical protein
MDAADLAGWRRQSGWPAWLLSLLLHFSVLIGLGFVAGKTPEGAADEPARAGGIVLVNRQAGKAQYFSEDNGNGAPGAAASASATQARPNPFPDSQEQPTIAGGPKLPADRGQLVGAAPAAGGSLPSPGSLSQGGGKGGPLGRGQDFGVQTQVFGVQGRGSRFVYVFDRSGSMSGYEGRPLAAAKRELLESLQSLQGVHQFQIVFYNQDPRLMSFAAGDAPQMVFANDEGQRQAERFVGSIVADGGTDHVKALEVALKMRPDVIFFLTDADEPQLSRSDLDRIGRLNYGTVINAIEFGAGPKRGDKNFLQSLAEENAGQHGYVDVTRLPK